MKLTKNKKIILTILSLFLVITPCLVLADGWEMPNAGDYGDVPTELDESITKATNWLLGFVAMIAVLAIVWGGINYIGSAGDEEKARTAKKTITYGLLGLVVAGFAYAIVKVFVVTIL